MSSTENDSLVPPEVNQAVDRLEKVMLENFPEMTAALNHVFCKGMYIRECVMEAGMRISSKIHLEKHPYFVMAGIADVWIYGTGWKRIRAPYFGITQPGTRRVLRIIERCHWITCHANPDDGEDLGVIESRIIEPHENKLLNNTPS